ncbi:MMPL family transporter [Pseudarthrobacter defluvii]|uniref:MMPL family transporter n=1 Tax=Pseudarthrobacter defluvii TaxID=410837 RepID=UPI00257579E2|nr:MMPL family transporter [Pseudarthrobacter defluvii]WJH26851.1 MMPL family transporter [Pseudarthrobacter defluvii]
MASLLYHLGRLAYRRRWWVLALWTAVVLGTGGAAIAFQGTMSNNFSIPGTESQRVLDQLEKELPQAAGGSGAVVFHAPSGSFTPAQKQAIGDALARLKDIPEVQAAANPFELQSQIDAGSAQLAEGKAQLENAKKQITEGRQQLDAQQAQLDAAAAAGVPGMDQALGQLKMARDQLDAGAKEIAANEEALALGQRKLDASAGMRTVSADGKSAVTQIQFTESIYEVKPEVREEVKETITSATASGVDVYLSQSITQDVSEVLGTAEIIGVGVAALVLIVMLGTLVAAGLPLLMAIIGVAVGVGGTFALSGVIEMASVSVFLALMLGLAVGIDYSLFIVNRHRTQLLHGMTMEESVARATGTSGNSVLFAGLTVVIALAALAVPGLPFLTIMGLAGAGTVALAVAVALTLTPAMLGFIGTRILSRRAWAKARASNAAADEKAALAGLSTEALEEAEDQEHSRHGWGAFVTRHPIIILTVTVLALAITALPAAQLRVALPDGGTEPVNSDAYKAYTTLGESFGEGVNGPIIAVGKLPAGLNAAESEDLQYDVADRLRDVKNVTAALPVLVSDDGRTAIFQVIPAEGPASASTEQVVADLRSAASDIETDTQVSIGLTGQTAANIDVSEKLLNALPLYLGVVIGLSLVLLLLVFRSIMVPLLATGGFLLSMAATFGAIVAVYQWGWLGEIFGVHNPAAVLSFLPIILIGVLFGLAMDYQVFLVSGMRESHIHGEDARTAVRTGFSHGARVVTAAAIIMTAVFAGFIFSGLTMVRPIGFSLSFGVLVDAFLIRMTIIPAAMHLLAEKAWWIPRWLDRILPDVDVEGAKLPAAPVPTGLPSAHLASTRD